MSVFFIFAQNDCMILISGNSAYLEDAMSRKLTDMRCGEVVRTDVESLPAVLSDRCRDIETLYHFVGRNVAPDAAFGLDYLQWLWSAAAQKAVPLMLVLWKFESDDSLNPLVGQFAEWVRKQYRKPPFHFICALGEVYGGEEMDSLMHRFCRDIMRDGYATVRRYVCDDGSSVERETDFVYVTDVLRVLYWLSRHRPESGLYELGTGFPRTDTAVVGAIFRAMGLPPKVEYDSVPSGSVEFGALCRMTNPSRLRKVGYRKPFVQLEKGVKSYVHRTFNQQ